MKKIKLAVAGSALIVSLNASATTTIDLSSIDHPAVAVAGTDFTNLEQDSYVYVEDLQGLDFANMLMCIAGASGIPLIPNGQYLAVADLAMCGDGDGTGVPNYTQMIVDSSRASSTSGQESKVWIEYNNGGTLELIHFLANVTAAPSDANPMGEWTLGWEFQSTPPLETGYLSASIENGAPRLDMVIEANESGGNGTQTRLSTFQMTGLNSGRGTLSVDSSNGYYGDADGTVVTNIVITDDYVGTQVGSATPICLDVNDMSDTVYEYNLYDTSGALVDISSNLEFTTGSGSHGVLGSYYDYTSETTMYWIWVEEDTENGPSTTSVTDSSNVSYTLTWNSNGNLTSVVDGSTGSEIAFDEPLLFDRTTASNISPNTDRNDSTVTFESATGDNNHFSTDNLSYSGPGRLHGFTWSSGSDAAPVVALADGTKLIDSSGNSYYVKAANISRNPATGSSGCSSMNYSPLTLPAATLAVAPSGMTNAPAVSTEPRVLDGELVE